MDDWIQGLFKGFDGVIFAGIGCFSHQTWSFSQVVDWIRSLFLKLSNCFEDSKSIR